MRPACSTAEQSAVLSAACPSPSAACTHSAQMPAASLSFTRTHPTLPLDDLLLLWRSVPRIEEIFVAQPLKTQVLFFSYLLAPFTTFLLAQKCNTTQLLITIHNSRVSAVRIMPQQLAPTSLLPRLPLKWSRCTIFVYLVPNCNIYNKQYKASQHYSSTCLIN